MLLVFVGRDSLKKWFIHLHIDIRGRIPLNKTSRRPIQRLSGARWRSQAPVESVFFIFLVEMGVVFLGIFDLKPFTLRGTQNKGRRAMPPEGFRSACI